MLICGTFTEYESRKTDHIYPTASRLFYTYTTPSDGVTDCGARPSQPMLEKLYRYRCSTLGYVFILTVSFVLTASGTRSG
jgi:hypothetical protein